MVNVPQNLTRSLGCLGVLLTLATILYSGINQIVYGHFRGESVDDVHFTPDSRILVGYGNLSTPNKTQQTLYAWDTHTGHLRWKKSSVKYIHQIDISPDGTSLLVAQSEGIDLYDVQTGNQKAHINLTGIQANAYFTQDSKHLLLSPDGSHLEIVDISSQQTTRRLHTQTTDLGFTLSPDRKFIAFYKYRTLVLRNIDTEQTLSTKIVTTTEGAFPTSRDFHFLSENLVGFGMWVWNPAQHIIRPLNEEEDRVEAPDRSCYVTLEYRGGQNKRFPLGQLISYTKDQPDVTLEGKAGW